jgi:hypothetical protein
MSGHQTDCNSEGLVDASVISCVEEVGNISTG